MGQNGNWESEGIYFTHSFQEATPPSNVFYHLKVQAFNNKGEQVAFTEMSGFNQRTIMPHKIEVKPDYRRKGIATAMYLYAEKVTSLKIEPNHEQSDMGYALWCQGNRPFGDK